jgi:very-short-patch-repair endonuclease
MKLLWILVAATALAVVAAALGSARRPKDPGFDKPWPLEPKSTLLSDSEQVLFRRLVQALPSYIVFAQVQLLQVLCFKRSSRDRRILNRISQLSLDFLIVGSDTRIIAAVELDDASHDREDRRAADARKAHALKSAGVPLLRWSSKEIPDAKAIGAAIETAAPVGERRS